MVRNLVALAFAVICIALVNAEEKGSEGIAKHRIFKARMAEETSSFKATLNLEGSSEKKEVRRFVLPKHASTDFHLLEEKLKTVFQSLQSLPFSVTWEDSEGDEVLISSDEELKIAINEMKGEVYRLKIEVKSASGLKDENAEARMAEETSTFKAILYLEGSSGKNEVRRFVLPKNASTDFILLEEKLKTVFQSLQSLPFSMTWEDSEGDEVLISNDEELKIAINKMEGEVNRLKIKAKSASGLKDENAEARMAEETSTFKAILYLEGSSGKNEVRRFVLPKNASTDFILLEEKLKTVFQSLQSLPFSMTWEDSEGDEVLISNDEELKIAINKMEGEVNRLKIKAKSASGLKDENAEDNKTEEEVPMKFHERAGGNIVLSNGNRTAARKNNEATYDKGSVITNRPLKDNELFEVRLEKMIDNWGNGFSLGVTVLNPTTVSFQPHWVFLSNGVWIYYLHGIWNNQRNIQSGYGIDLEAKLKVGDRVGVMRKSNGSLHFFVNGTDYGAIPTTVPETVYGVMDLCGDAVQATIVKP